MPRRPPLNWRRLQVEDSEDAPLEFIDASNALLMLLRRHHGEAGRFDIPPELQQSRRPTS
jgi:hypothetical protein